MQRSLFLGCAWLLLWTAALADETQQYGRRIQTPATLRPELKAAVADLKETLQQITGGEFTVAADGPAKGILLRRADAPDVPPEAVKHLASDRLEACVLWPDGDGKLWLISRSDQGLSHAIYFYLEELGCRWYFPSPRWTIIPKRPDIRLTQPVAKSPAFQMRTFAGSGGFGGNLPLDPERKLQQRWTDWQRRNRFGGEFRISGHTGEAFNTKYRKELEARPEWRAMVNGERVPWSLTAKFCAGNKDVVDLYVKDRLADLRLRRQRDPLDPSAWAVSVEPADGGGHCTAPESLALGSASDRVFHVANQVAKAVRQEFPDGWVSLLAYNEHAGVPSIELEPNVYLLAIPYAFQRTGLTPEQLLDAWSRKLTRMGVYDYWSIPDWSHDLPAFDPLGLGPDRLRGWHRRGIDGFLCESTYSSGAMGPAWYIGSRLGWEPEADVPQLFGEFLQDCFGPAAEPLRRMVTRWASGFTLTSHELALSYRDLQEAGKLVEGNEAITARIADYGRYVEYLRLYFEYQQTKRGTSERRAAAERLLRYQWSIYDSTMIHAFRLSQLLARDEMLAGNLQLGQTYNWQDRQAPAWATIRPVTDEEIRARVEQGVRDFQPQDIDPWRYFGPLTPVSKAPLPVRELPVLSLSNSLEFQVLAEQRDVVFRPKIASELPVRLVVSGPDGTPLTDVPVVTGSEWRTAWSTPEVRLPEPGLYQMQIVSQKRPFRFQAPADVRLSFPGWTNSQGAPTPRLYFYVPPDEPTVAIYANYIPAGPPRFFDPSGVEVKPDLVDQGHLLIVKIPPEHRGQVWSLDRAKCPLGPLQMLTVPNSFALTPETLLVPREALPTQRP